MRGPVRFAQLSLQFIPILLKFCKCFLYWPEDVHVFLSPRKARGHSLLLSMVVASSGWRVVQYIIDRGALCTQLLSRCFFHALKMCMWVLYSPQISFVTLTGCELKLFCPPPFSRKARGHINDIILHSVPPPLSKLVPCLRNLYGFMPILLKLCRCFGHCLKMPCACGLDIIFSCFCHFSSLDP